MAKNFVFFSNEQKPYHAFFFTYSITYALFAPNNSFCVSVPIFSFQHFRATLSLS